MGLGKSRTKLGDYMDSRGIKQKWLAEKVGVNRHTVASLCNDPDYKPNLTTIQRILRALKQIDPNVSGNRFWDV